MATVPNNEAFTAFDIYDAISGSHPAFSNLVQAFTDANPALFDPCYYPYYLVAGSNLLAHNSQLNFRNYGGTPDGIPIPVATAATDILYWQFIANWNASVGSTAYYIDVSTESDFSSFVYENYETMFFPNHETYILFLAAGTTYYYRLRANTLNGMSGNSNTISVTTSVYTSSYHDWILPPRADLQIMHDVLYVFDKGNFDTGIYWTSSDVGANAYAYYMAMGTDALVAKTQAHRVRAVRGFSSSTLYDPGDEVQGGIVYNKTGPGPIYTYSVCTDVDISIFKIWDDAVALCIAI